jgi:hypothetical protein
MRNRLSLPLKLESPKPLAPKRLEETLELLLRADSAGRASRQIRAQVAGGLVMDQCISKLGGISDLFLRLLWYRVALRLYHYTGRGVNVPTIT